MGYSTIHQDEQHLRLLSMFHYILAAMMALFACFPIIHLVIGISFLVAPEKMMGPNQPPGGPPPLLFGLMFTIIPLVIILLGWVMAGLVFYGGRCLANRTHYTFCLVVAGFACLNMPLGTVLGVFTIIVLIRPSVQALFQNKRFEQVNL